MKISYLKKLLVQVNERRSLSDNFHLSTNNIKIDKIKLGNIPNTWTNIHFKSYPRLEKDLLETGFSNKNNIGKFIRKRRSLRDYKNKAISKAELSYLLYGSSGLIKSGKSLNKSRRPYPSAGARYPLEVYPLIFNCDGFQKGIYHYNVKENHLEVLLQKDLRSWFFNITGGEKWLKKASVVFIISGVFDRTRIKYGDRGYRYILIEVGHLAQNLLLIATELKLQSCPLGGFIDDEINKLLDIDNQKERVLYLIAVGKNE